jgi:hypothetical protein
MLMYLLSLVAGGGVQVYAALADQLGVSTSLLAQMLQDLARMGYIMPLSGACDTSLCHHCPLGGSCTTDKQGNVWVLTAKGTQAARKK